jgi:hypothetical protein
VNVVRRFVRGLGVYAVELIPFLALYGALTLALTNVLPDTPAAVVAVTVTAALMLADEYRGRPVRSVLEQYGPLPAEEGSS